MCWTFLDVIFVEEIIVPYLFNPFKKMIMISFDFKNNGK